MQNLQVIKYAPDKPIGSSPRKNFDFKRMISILSFPVSGERIVTRRADIWLVIKNTRIL